MVVVLAEEVVVNLPIFSAKYVSNLDIQPMFVISYLMHPISLINHCFSFVLLHNSPFLIWVVHIKHQILG